MIDEVRVETAVFHRLSQATRDDNAASLYSISMELARLQLLLTQALEGLAS